MSLAGVALLRAVADAPGPLDAPDAACLGVPPEVMHPVAGAGSPGKAYYAAVAAAQQVCALCPAATNARCLAYALDWPGDLSGVWGGVEERQLNAVKRARTT